MTRVVLSSLAIAVAVAAMILEACVSECPSGPCAVELVAADAGRGDAALADASADAGAPADAHTMEVDAAPTDEQDAGLAPAPDASAPLHLERLVDHLRWLEGYVRPAMAVDPLDRVYLTADEVVYRVDGTAVERFLSRDDAPAIVGRERFDLYFLDLDVDPSGTLWVLTNQEVFTSTAAHSGQVRRSGLQAMDSLGVVSPELLVVLSSVSGLWALSPAGDTQVYEARTLHASSGCATVDLAVQRSGTIAYEPGCNTSPMLLGHVDGRPVRVARQEGTSTGEVPMNFLCVARDPAGGFYVMTERLSGGAVLDLMHFDEDATPTSGWRVVPVEPSFGATARAEGELSLFRYCSLGVGASGTVYLETEGQLWRMRP